MNARPRLLVAAGPSAPKGPGPPAAPAPPFRLPPALVRRCGARAFAPELGRFSLGGKARGARPPRRRRTSRGLTGALFEWAGVGAATAGTGAGPAEAR